MLSRKSTSYTYCHKKYIVYLLLRKNTSHTSYHVKVHHILLYYLVVALMIKKFVYYYYVDVNVENNLSIFLSKFLIFFQNFQNCWNSLFVFIIAAFVCVNYCHIFLPSVTSCCSLVISKMIYCKCCSFVRQSVASRNYGHTIRTKWKSEIIRLLIRPLTLWVIVSNIIISLPYE